VRNEIDFVRERAVIRVAKRAVCGVEFADQGWPKQPSLSDLNELTDAQFSALVELIKTN